MDTIKSGAMQNRRNEPRYPVRRGVKALFGQREGVVIDVSKGGLGIHFEGEDVFPGSLGAVDIEAPRQEFFLGRLPVRTVTHCEQEDEFLKGVPVAKRCGIVFGDLKPHQRFQLDYFIWLNTHGEG